jgi:hypothetical protein
MCCAVDASVSDVRGAMEVRRTSVPATGVPATSAPANERAYNRRACNERACNERACNERALTGVPATSVHLTGVPAMSVHLTSVPQRRALKSTKSAGHSIVARYRIAFLPSCLLASLLNLMIQ